MSYSSGMATPDEPAREALSAPQLPSPAPQARWWRVLAMAAGAALLVGWISWYVQTPEPLPTDDETVTASGVVGTPVYVGMFTVPEAWERDLSIDGVKLRTTASTDVGVAPLLCRGGAVGVTTAPEQFCTGLEDPEGATLVPGDTLLVEVVAETAALAEVDRIQVAFREGIRSGTSPAGHAGAVVSVLSSAE